MGFPDGSVVKKLLTSAGDTGSFCGPGRIHVPWSTTTTEPARPRAFAPQREVHAPQLESAPTLAATREKPTQQRRPHTVTNQFILRKAKPSYSKP